MRPYLVLAFFLPFVLVFPLRVFLRGPVASLEDEQGLVLPGEAGEGDLDDLGPGGLLGSHVLVHGAAAEGSVAVAVLGADDGEGVTGVGA